MPQQTELMQRIALDIGLLIIENRAQAIELAAIKEKQQPSQSAPKAQGSEGKAAE